MPTRFSAQPSFCMSKHDPHVTLLQVYDFTKEGIDLATQGSLGRLDSDRAYLRAAERIIYLIGEAASRLPDELRSAHPEIPWAQIIGMRMRLAHGYESISKSLPLPSSIPLRAAPQADRLCHPSPTRTLRLFQPEPIPIKPWTDPPPKTTPSLQQLKGRSKHALRPRWPGPAASSKSWPPASSAAIRAIAKPRPTLQAARISGITSLGFWPIRACPFAMSRPVIDAMSSCKTVPARCAISPITTGDCLCQ